MAIKDWRKVNSNKYGLSHSIGSFVAGSWKKKDILVHIDNNRGASSGHEGYYAVDIYHIDFKNYIHHKQGKSFYKIKDKVKQKKVALKYAKDYMRKH